MSVLQVVRRRAEGSFHIDEWGLDPDLVRLVAPLTAWRWSIDVTGAEHVPPVGPAILVHNRRFAVSEPWVLADAVGRATGRWVRSMGAPDFAPIGPAVRRLGAVLDRPEELAGLLRAGQVVARPLDRLLRDRRQAGALAPEALAPALEAKVPVLPVALLGREIGRRWRVVIGPAIDLPAGRGPLAVAELADRAQAGVQDHLDAAYPPGRFW